MNFNATETKVIWDALQQYIDNTPEREEIDSREWTQPAVIQMLADRDAAVKALERIEAAMIPAMLGTK